MLYLVQPGDSLYAIAARFGTTVQAILQANVICNPGLIFVNEPLIVPAPGQALPRAGGSPYYVVLPGDTLYCLAGQFGSSVQVLAANNQISNPNYILAGSELLVIPNEIPDPAALKAEWERTGGVPCESIPELTVYGVYYLGTFQWAALGATAISYLADLAGNPCAVVRLYTAQALGRIGLNASTTTILRGLSNDPDPAVAEQARFSLRRIELIPGLGPRLHILTTDNQLIGNLNIGAPVTPLPVGTQIWTVRWHIPSPTGEEGPRGGIQMYDQVQVVGTGQYGYLPRFGYDQLTFI